KSISLTEAKEEAVAREVHATHARIMSGLDPEPMQEDHVRIMKKTRSPPCIISIA
ncbi:hypothetical protein Tco_0555199, partial [Tanacetum coccineum]